MPNASIDLRLTPEDKALQRQVDDDEVKLEATKLTHFSFELEQRPLGGILQSAATLAGYNFWIMPNSLLITQQRLTPTEQYLALPWGRFMAVLPSSVRCH